jgi:exocyst complex component 5
MTDCSSSCFIVRDRWLNIPTYDVAVLSWLAAQLAKQKKNDFKPRNDDLSFARVNTEPCVSCCETLEKVRDAAKASLSGKNLEAFLTEIGVAFHAYVHL